jgi:nicotinate-nucleotide adenylyltransferase
VNIALFGGTFDPIHSGHLTAATAAQEAFSLDEIRFVPAFLPPHKHDRAITPFLHRYAMVALACAGNAHFFPSLLEMEPQDGAKPNYSIFTVRRMLQRLSPGDRLYFLLGADAFLDIAQWHQPVELLDACDFIIVSRPGFSADKIQEVIPQELKPASCLDNRIQLRKTTLHLLSSVEADISSSTIRELAAQGRSLCGMVPEAVSDYVQKQGLYLRTVSVV